MTSNNDQSRSIPAHRTRLGRRLPISLLVTSLIAGLSLVAAPSANAARYSVSATPKASTVQIYTSAVVTGTVSPRAPGQSVALQRYVSGKWTTVKKATLSWSSAYSVSFTTSKAATWKVRVVKSASNGHTTGVSSTRTIYFVPKFTVSLHQTTTAVSTQKRVFKGTVRPISTAAKVRIQRWSGSTWSTVGYASVNSIGSYSWTTTLPEPGQRKYRAVMPTVSRKAVTGVTAARNVTTVRGSTTTAGYQHMCRIATTQVLRCWGNNASGQVGSGATDNLNGVSPRVVASPSTWATVSAGGHHSCGVRTDQTGWCWGRGTESQLGVGDENRDTPVQVPGQWLHLSAGYDNTCGIRSDLTAWCWGRGSGGKLGNGTEDDALSPVQVSTVNGSKWVAIEAYSYTTCGIRLDGTGACWGNNTDGQVGAGSDTDYLLTPTPLAATNPSGWSSITPSEYHTCGRKLDGTAWCWGDYGSGALGVGERTEDAPAPLQVAGTWRMVDTGYDGSCGVRTDGTLWCWGDFILDDSDSPLKVGTLTTWRSLDVSSGGYACGYLSDSTTRCWGENGDGQHGDGAQRFIRVPTPVAGEGDWFLVDGGSYHTCGIRTDESLWCWGQNNYGQLGNGSYDATGTPTQVLPGTKWAGVTTGDLHTCGIRTQFDAAAPGTLWCWGRNTWGQLGTGAAGEEQWAPVKVGTQNSWLDVAAGANHTCGIGDGESMYCWGRASSGQLGIDPLPATDLASPTKVDEFADDFTWSRVSAGGDTTCGLASDGFATTGRYCWGASSGGQTGTGISGAGQHETRPTAGVEGGTNYGLLQSGNSHSCATRTDGSLHCWGDAGFHQLGTGSTTDQDDPTHILPGSTWNGLALGYTHSCGLRLGALWCWGANTSGQLGNGGNVNTPATTPVQIGNITDWTGLGSGDRTSCGIRLDNSLWCWGANSNGEAGDGSVSRRYSPLLVSQPS